jgi:hypothetical protein
MDVAPERSFSIKEFAKRIASAPIGGAVGFIFRYPIEPTDGVTVRSVRQSWPKHGAPSPVRSTRRRRTTRRGVPYQSIGLQCRELSVHPVEIARASKRYSSFFFPQFEPLFVFGPTKCSSVPSPSELVAIRVEIEGDTP